MKASHVLSAALALGLATTGLALAQSSGTTPSTNPATTAAPSSPSAAGTTTTDTSLGHNTQATPDNNAVNTSSKNNPGAPVPGANSFTEGQARSRMEDGGFSQVTDLKLDNQGIWRGSAMKNGQKVNVAMDFQGNVTQQ